MVGRIAGPREVARARLVARLEAEARQDPGNRFVVEYPGPPPVTVAMRQGLSCRRRKVPVTLAGGKQTTS